DFQGQKVSAVDRLYLASQVPVMIMWGAKDAIIPVDHARAAHREMPGSQLEILEGVGHFPHAEAPDRFLALIDDFMTSTRPSRVTPTTWRLMLAQGKPTSKASATRAATARRAG